ncbi:hypothetical protein FRX31_012449 [Thalictrum thalictroides]|uniref:Uncharacterized protein n=1 Tax=Thalictrum thalictroides TaxID=46969 RepID=A0A7J6WPA1_THATH|nr:hypothetical protein FRX31_012449 [Thalictrum thalictroides]
MQQDTWLPRIRASRASELSPTFPADISIDPVELNNPSKSLPCVWSYQSSSLERERACSLVGCLQIPAGEERDRLVPLRFGAINQDVSIGENGVQGARVRLSRATDSRKTKIPPVSSPTSKG